MSNVGPNDDASNTEVGVCQTDLKESAVNFINNDGFVRNSNEAQID
jgi:hypothetical protein